MALNFESDSSVILVADNWFKIQRHLQSSGVNETPELIFDLLCYDNRQHIWIGPALEYLDPALE